MNKPKLFQVFNVIGMLAVAFSLVGRVGAYPLTQERIGDILYVDLDATGLNDGSSWENAFIDLQDALAVTVKDDQIWVAEGTYYPTATTDRSISFSMIDGVAVYGGFAGAETAPEERVWGEHPTILSGDIGVENVATDNSYHVVFNKSIGNTAMLDGFIITGGYADGTDDESSGAGVYIYSSSPRLRNITISNNHAIYNGGGIYNADDSSATLDNIIFSNNDAYFGGGMCNYNSKPSLTNVTFAENSAIYGGGLEQFSSSSNATLVNVTFHGNEASTSGGGIQNNSGTISLSNAILWGNTPSQIEGPGSVEAIYSIIQSPSVYPGTGNSNEDPLLDPLADNGGFTPTYALLPGSPAIDTGADRVCPATDQRGVPRFLDGDENGTEICDMGAFEFNPILFVDHTAVGLNNGTTWTDAFVDLQSALSYASAGSEIWVAEGTYYPTDTNDRSISFVLKNDVGMYGGFAGTETKRDERDWEANPTILSGNIGLPGDAYDNSFHVVISSGVGTNTILDGFTIMEGNADSDEIQWHRRGGGMYNQTGSEPTLINLTFSGNLAIYGGGIYDYDSNPTMINVTFSGNLAQLGGGGIFNYDSSPTLTNVTFSGNSANRGGGIYNDWRCSPTLTNVTFSSNSALWEGGGIYNEFDSSPNLTNVTFSGNDASIIGGGICNKESSSPILINVILWDNIAPTGAEIYNDDSTPQISYSDIQGCGGSSNWNSSCGVDGGHNIDTNPFLGSLADNGGFTQTHALLTDSPAIDAGSPTTCPETDQRGVARPLDGDGDGTAVCDIGAYEAPPIIFVDQDATGLNDGSSWEDAFTKLQDALAAATSGNQVWVAEGTYYPTTTTDRTISFSLKNGVGIYGGFTGAETSRNQRNWEANSTILSGNIGDPELASDNSYHVVISYGVGASTILDGFIITGGFANGEDYWLRVGGGMRNYDNSTATFANLTFSGNSAYWDGGGIYNAYSSPTLTNVNFSCNSAMLGGGMFNHSSNPILKDVTFSGNTASSGGGINNNGSNATLTNVTFSSNSASGEGGGMLNHMGHPTLTNVTFSGNSARFGGGIRNEDCSPTLTNVTFSNNSAEWGGGIYNHGNGNLTLTNIILWGNIAPNGMSIFNSNYTTLISYSDIQGCGGSSSWNSDCGVDGGHNIDADPLLGPLADNGGYTMTHALLFRSPAIDAGSPTTYPETDQRGVTRPLDGDGDGTAVCDMGAFEFEPTFGTLKISKTFNPLTSGFTGSFTITYDCDDGTLHDGTVNLRAGKSTTISGIPTGTTCTVREDTLPKPPEGWCFGTPTLIPQNGVVTVIEKNQVYVVTVINSIYSISSQFKLFLPLVIGD